MVNPMSAAYRLHYAPDNASLVIRLALEQLGLPYRTVLIDRAAREQDSPRFLALNPNGLLPVPETPDGPLFETGAILLWLSDYHGGLAPRFGAAERRAVMTWPLWLSSTLHVALRMLFYPSAFARHDHAALMAATKSRLLTLLAMLEAADVPWLDRPSILSCYVAPMLRWMALYPAGETDWFVLPDHPRLAAIVLMMEARPSAPAAMAAEGLGKTPLSAPGHCRPPDGSAL